jgi:hypothetical protein
MIYSNKYQEFTDTGVSASESNPPAKSSAFIVTAIARVV